MTTKPGGRQRSVWTPGDIERADVWWRRRHRRPDDAPTDTTVTPSAPESGKRTNAGRDRHAAKVTDAPAADETSRPRRPAVPAYLSVHSEYLVCMECAERHQDLAPHLRAAHGLEPEEYRRRWNLPEDYSMICPWDRLRQGR
jgi:hypothetical protein